MRRGDVLLADLVEALVRLDAADAGTRSEIARMLGLELSVADARPEVVPGAPAEPLDEDPTDVRDRERDPDEQVEELPIRLRRTASHPPERERRRPTITAPPLDPPEPGAAPRPPDPKSLLRPQWTRGIVSGMLAGAAPGPVDVDRAVEILARAEPLNPVPVLPRSTLRNGVQVLLDRSTAMMPFFRDQAVLVEQLRPLVGSHRLEVLRFTGSPARGAGPRGPRTWRPYEPPQPNATVLLVSDLGSGHAPLATDAASVAEWARFARTVGSAGCGLVALNPYPRERLPRGLPRTLRVVRWDRATTARAARRARGRPRWVT